MKPLYKQKQGHLRPKETEIGKVKVGCWISRILYLESELIELLSCKHVLPLKKKQWLQGERQDCRGQGLRGRGKSCGQRCLEWQWAKSCVELQKLNGICSAGFQACLGFFGFFFFFLFLPFSPFWNVTIYSTCPTTVL